jgi:excinuclease ABC subunit B
MLDTDFFVEGKFKPSGDQPKAIKEITDKFTKGEKKVVLYGATGTGKSATTAWVIEKIKKPTLVICPNKVLAAQLANELKELFPKNKVCFFISHFAYYRPEAYIPATDTFVEKDSAVDDEIERLRHEATTALLTRKDVIVVASVSAIYGLGRPEEYKKNLILLNKKSNVERDELIRKFIDVGYNRNDSNLERGNLRVRGDVIDIVPSYGEEAFRLEFFGDEIEKITILDYLTGKTIDNPESIIIPPATHHLFDPAIKDKVLVEIREELKEREKYFAKKGKELEKQRLTTRINNDIEMITHTGSCKGIENYSAHFDQRIKGVPPNTLLDFFPEDFLLVIDESHITVPQIGAMYEGDQARKRTLVEYGFRLPSALDNRPLKAEEFWGRNPQTLLLSATPSRFEEDNSESEFVEQIIRPTGLVDPLVIVDENKDRLDKLIRLITDRIKKNQRTLVITITKKQSEQLSIYLTEKSIKNAYLHHEVSTSERIDILRKLRKGQIDVVVGVNLLREGLDLPEVSLIAILDTDNQGFLRSYSALIQIIGRAARNPEGTVIMYADKVTPAMKKAIDETARRRAIQEEYNHKNNITPKALLKSM